MKRITPAAVRRALAKTGLQLVRGKWGDGVTCGCPQMVLAAQDGRRLDAFTHACQLFGDHYSAGFRNGFDGKESFNCSRKYATGYADGRKVAEELL